jgi:hypothetical protein
MIWDGAVPDEERNNLGNIGCANAVAREAAPSSATNGACIDIARRMPQGAVNLQKEPSAMGRGVNMRKNGELGQQLEDHPEGHYNQPNIGKTSGVMRSA